MKQDTLILTLANRLKSFEDSKWPETNPSPISLAEAGFFYDRKLATVKNLYRVLLHI
jgi:hypothetical protein